MLCPLLARYLAASIALAPRISAALGKVLLEALVAALVAIKPFLDFIAVHHPATEIFIH